ncbi:dipeptidase PepV [Anaerobacillus sp. CMMVII]|uniref:dipeptidase PepV n=1 Tax=Anaerobacillus sp. CMMVII TaxID=2755588 RepID=UPI0021B7E083|nr:dipeptidase PepV [Anaerobacillus sp. CMMVII]MCT8137273.1 dipeptidase PepV [Anaerobacillus sp. CMMVII]
MHINWKEEVELRKENLLKDTCGLLKIKSVLDEKGATANAPFGEEINKALLFMLQKGEETGFDTKNVDGYAGHIEFGAGEELVGILGHIDVVPEGDGWSNDPYGAEIRDGKIYARGAIDDKGPTMAAFYGMKIINELGLPLSKRVRLIIGADEESQWRCVDRYFQTEEMPSIGFAPDADFPIINAEKGICDFEIVFPNGSESGTLRFFEAGRRFNMVPDFATATLHTNKTEELREQFSLFLQQNQLQGETTVNGKELTFTLFGISAHGMEPNKGINAGIYLAHYLQSLQIEGSGADFVAFIDQHFYNDSRGAKFGLEYEDEQTGPLTMNLGTMKFEENSGKLGVNWRYPVTYNFEAGLMALEAIIAENGLVIDLKTHAKPHYVKEDHPLIQKLQQVYERQTGEKATLLSTGGGTYARSLKAGVAFGALFPGRPELAHQKDEYIEVEDLLKATAIYAEAIYELAK